MNSLRLYCPKDMRNIAQAAVKKSGTERTIKISYPYENGQDLKIEFNQLKALFDYACAYGILLNEVDPAALKKKPLLRQGQVSVLLLRELPNGRQRKTR